MPDKSNADATYRFRVEGIDGFTRSSSLRAFDETYEIEGEHPAQAVERLMHEIEWGILDSDREFSITYLGAICSHQKLIGREHCNRCQLEGFCDCPGCRADA